MRIHNSKLHGHLRIGQLGVATPCVISDFSHNTGSVRAQHSLTNSDFSRYGAAGTTWSYQAGRWTAPNNTSLEEFSTEPGPAQYYVDDIPVGNVGTTVNELASAIRNVRGWYAQVDTVQSGQGQNATFVDPVLMVAYTGGALKQGLRIAYPNDRQGDTAPHPAVELFNNGNWHHGSPTDGACVVLSPSDYASQLVTFPGSAASLDERGGRGAFGAPASTTTTRGPAPEGGAGVPAIVSTATVVPSDPVTKFGLSPTVPLRFSIKNGNETNQVEYTPYDGDTIYNLISAINDQDNTGVHAYFFNGKVAIGNTNPGVTTTDAFDFTDQDQSGILEMFGSNSPTVTTIKSWLAVASSTRYTLATPLAQFAPKGLMEIGIERGYPQPDITIGYIVGSGGTLPNGATQLRSIGDLIDAINAVDSGTSLYAYLENGHLVVALFDGSDEPDFILGARYADESPGIRLAVELLYGAADYRNGQGYLYSDAPVEGQFVYPLAFAGSTIPPLPSYPEIAPAITRTGDRALSLSTLVSTLYPVGTTLMRYDTNGYTYQFFFIEVTATTTMQDIINTYANASLTLRFVDDQGNHTSSGFLRLTSGSAGNEPQIVWWDRATTNYGIADRFFHDAGNDGTVPTNVTGQIP